MGTITEQHVHDIFDNAINQLRSLNPPANELSSVKMKLDEAEAFTKKKLVGEYPDDENVANQNKVKQDQIDAQKAQTAADEAQLQGVKSPQQVQKEKEQQAQGLSGQSPTNPDDFGDDQSSHEKHLKKKH
jgi:hypothetical protein